MDVLSTVSTYGVAGLDKSGLLFEPRALWSVGRFDTADTTPKPWELERGVVQLPIEDFRNPGRYPIVLTRLSFAGINYLLADNNAAAADQTGFRNCGAVLAQTKFLLSVPRRQFYSKQPILVGSLAARPTSDPSMLATATPYASSLFGASRLEFDKDLHLPRNGGIELWLGSPSSPPLAIADEPSYYPTWISIEENGGLAQGAARVKLVHLPTLATTGVPVFEPDSFGVVGGGNALSSLVPFGPRGLFSLNEFLKQKTVRGENSAAFQAINVFIDQIAFDDDVQDSVLPTAVGTPLTPLSLRVPTRCRTRGGGTGEDWWRPGAPLGLVFTELTPATVYDLPQPITLNPGDCLSLQLQFPTDTIVVPKPGTDVTPIYQVGVAASGFAVIEG